ncbi:MAG: chromosome segregation protein SMC [Acidobacteria bacterium]|nr:chromosome segregation protein SMC [Acidobacteriota bacterium]
MKGFKSFADDTVLDFETGVTAVVGPNGSGKSNVVDAVAWVLGAQSARAMRSTKMEDVIFSGTARRAALGRCEVSLTLDNSSGLLPIETAEVTISRTLYRNGDSEYAINGATCRLLDVQELLSDSGVGRSQHMIIGQNQLDRILNSRPEERRAVIEEAAGVLKHRRRKERAERRLAQTQENLERLGDLVREVRRQMRPLERQAAAARNFTDIDAELKGLRRSLYAQQLKDFESRRTELEGLVARSAGEDRDLRSELVRLDALASAAAAEVASRREEHLASTLGQLQGLAERVRGTLSLIAERRRSVRSSLDASADENVVANLEADAARLTSDLSDIDNDEAVLAEQRAACAAGVESLHDAETRFENEWGDVSGAVTESHLLNAREQHERLSRSLATSEEALERLQQRATSAEVHRDSLRTLLANLTEAQAAAVNELELAHRAHRDAMDREDATEEELRQAEARSREADEHAARAQARAEALTRALDEFSGAGGRHIVGELDGVLGAFLDLVDVAPGWERAVDSAAGASLGAVVVNGRTSARAAIAALRREGGAGLILPVTDRAGERPSAPSGCTPLRQHVAATPGAPTDVTRVLDALFARAFVASDWESALDVALAHPDLIIVTPEGDRFASTGWRAAAGRSIVTRSSVDDAIAEAGRTASLAASARSDVETVRSRAVSARVATRHAAEVLATSDARHGGAVRDVQRVEGELALANDVVNATVSERTDVVAARDVAAHDVAALESSIAELEAALAGMADTIAAAASAKQALELQREAVSTAQRELAAREAELGERRRLLESRRSDIERRLAGHVAERAAAAERRESLEFELASLDRLERLVDSAGEDVRENQAALESTYREQLEATRAGAERLEEIRRERGLVESRLAGLGEAGRRADIELAETAVKISNLHEAIVRDIGVEPHALGLVAPPDLPEGVSLDERLVELETRMNALGPINPLALEELQSLESRYRELDGQVSDVRTARRELQEVVHALNSDIMTTFASAMADVNEHFSNLIALLFPGGQGRLTLTDDSDMLNTGVEIEVRPMGRNIRLVSLLSGGERSMAALAFSFAVFRSRPSPFYMMDEVEAALDDVNLQRFLSLVADFRDEAQLLIVTHQKRTMESADALYGVTMKPGDSSKVVSQRVNRKGTAEEPDA